MSKKQMTSSDAKILFMRHFERCVRVESVREDNDYDYDEIIITGEDDFREAALKFCSEFMSDFNIGFSIRKSDCYMVKTGKVGRPKGSKNKPDKELMHKAYAQAAQAKKAAKDDQEDEDDFLFERCPNCNQLAQHEKVNLTKFKCHMCGELNEKGEFNE